jgi:antitoxin HicB
MRTFAYPAILTPEKKGHFTVQFPDLPEAITSGRNLADALVQASDCLEEAIAGRISDGLEIPEPSVPRHRRGTRAPGKDAIVLLPAAMAAKAALYLAIRAAGVSNSELARRLDVHEREIRRLLDPRHATRLVRIRQVLEALGQRLVVSLESAA